MRLAEVEQDGGDFASGRPSAGSTSTGTFASGFIARNSGVNCSPLNTATCRSL